MDKLDKQPLSHDAAQMTFLRNYLTFANWFHTQTLNTNLPSNYGILAEDGEGAVQIIHWN